jgi:N-acetylglutamate synthase-like GNAT family acetyltransferase
MTIRGYRDTDLDACRTLWVELTQWHRDIFEAPEIGGDDPGSAFDRHVETIGADNVWVAEVDDQVVGLVGMIVDDTQAELEPIVVSPLFRGRGVGGALTDAVVAEAGARNLRTVVARPVARNADAVRFFHSAGFDILDHVVVMCDLVARDVWRPAEELAGRAFRA